MSKSELSLTDVSTRDCGSAPLVAAPLSEPQAIALAATFKALADPVRLRLLSAIAGRAGQESCVCDISDGLDISQPTISHHLKVLREAGLLTSQRRGSWVYYRLVPSALAPLSQLLGYAAEAVS
ncbi:ArsR/SmtB family transcription factor [Nocardia yamanashiensis]|uniref:ArsR/SmtB family transcription factor n=1 Tax=Nocardia yamanashiensis TaxID=209247 RepID=UPI000831AC50|nr:metalloregulator ArsR/SmtB family transcription factor [Nocardia yamanashiensis]